MQGMKPVKLKQAYRQTCHGSNYEVEPRDPTVTGLLTG